MQFWVSWTSLKIYLAFTTIHIGDPDFHQFIKVHLLDPIKVKNSEYELATMIAKVDDTVIFMWLQFANWTVKLVTLNAHQMFKATFAHVFAQNASKKEQKCLKRVAVVFEKLIEELST